MNNTFIIFTNIFVYLILGISFLLIPFANKKHLVFGVSVPTAIASSKEIHKIRNTYLILTTIVTLANGILVTLLGIKISFESEIYFIIYLISIFLLLILYGMIFLQAYTKVKKMKKDSHWKMDEQITVIVDTDFRKRKLAVKSVWFMLYLVIVSITLIAPLSLYDTLPELLPTHFDASGIADGWMTKNTAITLLPGIQVFMLLLFLFVNYIIGRSKQEIDPNNPEVYIAKNALFRYRMSLFMYFSGLLLEIMFLIIQLVTIGILSGQFFTLYLPFIITGIIVIGVFVLSLTSGQGGWKIKIKDENDKNNNINRNDDKYWKLGSFYYNPGDPSVFVEKRFGIGWTSNFARPISWVFILIIIGIIIFSILQSI